MLLRVPYPLQIALRRSSVPSSLRSVSSLSLLDVQNLRSNRNNDRLQKHSIRCGYVSCRKASTTDSNSFVSMLKLKDLVSQKRNSSKSMIKSYKESRLLRKNSEKNFSPKPAFHSGPDIVPQEPLFPISPVQAMSSFSLNSSMHQNEPFAAPAKYKTRPEIVGNYTDYLARILSSRVYDVAIETPLQKATNFSNSIQNRVTFKREDLQPVFSFKIRGAYNRIVHLEKEKLEKGIVACSAGNHAQGVALSASKLGIRAVIVMPLATPLIKVNAVRNFGGPSVVVKLHGASYDEASDEAKRLVREEGLTMIHPFNDPDVIAGQGTIGMEILKCFNGKNLDAIFICCGGGGMLAGIAAYVKSIRPKVKIIGVEAADAPSMYESLKAGHVVTLSQVGLFADGAAVKTVGDETFRLCSELVDDMVLVSTDEICQAIKTGFTDTRSILEPAGALGIAGAEKYSRLHNWTNKDIVCITSGANMDFDRLRFVSERADSTETLLAVRISEKPGSFKQLYDSICPRNVTEFSYRFNNPKKADIIISYQCPPGSVRGEDKKEVVNQIQNNGFEVVDLSDNEMAKAHARYLAGGRAPHVQHERLIRFTFPEVPAALKRFLSEISQGWNVTLFHYRNQGGDIARVLVGLQVPPNEQIEFELFLTRLIELGYTSKDETSNPVYRKFLF